MSSIRLAAMFSVHHVDAAQRSIDGVRFRQGARAIPDNPVFYVQYAHARAASVLRHADDMPADPAARVAWLTAADKRLAAPDELALIKVLAGWPRLIESAAESHEPHRIAFIWAISRRLFMACGIVDAMMRVCGSLSMTRPSLPARAWPGSGRPVGDRHRAAVDWRRACGGDVIMASGDESRDPTR